MKNIFNLFYFFFYFFIFLFFYFFFIFFYFFRHKSNLKKPEEFLDLSVNEIIAGQFPIRKIWIEYENEKKKNGAIDFGDMLSIFLEHFSKEENLNSLYKIQNRFKYILVDEFQGFLFCFILFFKILVFIILLFFFLIFVFIIFYF